MTRVIPTVTKVVQNPVNYEESEDDDTIADRDRLGKMITSFAIRRAISFF